MRGVPSAIQARQPMHFVSADPAYGAGVAKGLGIELSTVALTPGRGSAATGA